MGKTGRWLGLGVLAGLALAGCDGVIGDGGNGDGGGRCLGAGDPLVGACVFDDGSCAEYRGGIEVEEADVDCTDPAFPGTFQEAACPPATRTSGGCVDPLGGGTAVNYDASISATDLEQLCDQFGGCYLPP